VTTDEPITGLTTLVSCVEQLVWFTTEPKVNNFLAFHRSMINNLQTLWATNKYFPAAMRKPLKKEKHLCC